MKKRNSSVNKTIHNFYLSKLKNPKIKKLYSRFKRIISKDTDKNYCVAISGGPDSMALAFLMKCLSIEKGISNVYFHIDHKLRKESKKEALFIKKILKKFDVNLNILKSSPSTSIFLIGSLFFIILWIKICLCIEFHFKNTI